MQASEIRVLTASPTLCKAALGGGDLRYLRYARGFAARGLALEWQVCESDFTHADLERWPLILKQKPELAAMPAAPQRLALLDGLIRDASRLPQGGAVILAPAFSLDWPTIRLWQQARGQGTPSVFNTTMMPAPPRGSALARLKERLLLSLTLRLITRVVAQTESTKQELKARAWLPSKHIEVIGNGVDQSLFYAPSASERATARQSLEITDDATPVFLMVGSVIPRKGLHRLLEAWPQVLATVPDARLIVAGGFGQRLAGAAPDSQHQSYFEHIQSLIASLPSPGSVQLLGSVENTTPCYHAADAFVFASEREGLPNVVLEAMACGLPALFAEYAGIPRDGGELGSHGQHHLRSGPAPADLAAGMLQLAQDRDLRLRIGESAQRWISDTQGLEQVLDQWSAVYHEVSGMPR